MRTLELVLGSPDGSVVCEECLGEAGRELAGVAGVCGVEENPAGMLAIRYDDGALTSADVERFALRAGAQARCAEHGAWAAHDHRDRQPTGSSSGEASEQRSVLHITGMDCADCARKLEAALGRSDGVQDAAVSFGAATLTVVYDPARTSVESIATAVRRLGYDTLEGRAAQAGASERRAVAETSGKGATRAFWLRDRRAQVTALSGLFLLAGLAAQALASAAAPWLLAASIVVGGAHIAQAAFFSLRARQVEMNALMTLAVFGAVAIGEWSEAALVVVLFSLGTSLQAATLARTRGAIRGLMELTPPRVALMRSGVEVSVPASEARAGDLLLVRPGERLAVDGEVLEGHASANQAPITGEAAPVDKGPGDAVFAGSIVEGGSLLVRASSGLNDNSIAKIVHMVEEAQAQRAPLQTTVDRFASRYTPVVVGLALAVAIVPVVLGQPLATWLYRGLAVLIIACPCALVISTPVSILAGLTRAARDGILIKGGALLERSANVGAVAFDKTGTLTEGRPRVTDVVAFGGASEHRVLALSAAVERLSEHPLARAIVNAADAGLDGLTDGTSEDRGADASSCGCSCRGRCGATAEPCIVQRFRATPGTGVEAEVDGRRYFVGRPDQAGFADPSPLVKAAIQRLESEGKTVIALADDDAVLGVIALSDPLRPGAGRAVEHLRSLGVEHIVILTGDNRVTAAAIARRVGIDEVRAGLLPAEKLAATLALRERTSTVAMVGDGVNDAPALAGATIGIAMGAAGTDAALETADVVLMGDELEAIPETIVLARRTRRVVWQNIVLSIAVKALFLALAPLGLVTLWMAVFADMGTSLLVTANGLRLLRRGRNGRESHAGIRLERVTGGER